MEQLPTRHESKQERNFNGFDSMLEDFVHNRLPINRVLQLAPNTKIEDRPDTWISSTSQNDRGETIVKIGEQLLPRQIAEQCKWGAETKEQQYVVKVSHEYAHILQEEFDAQLLRWLDGAADIPDEYAPYIQLYAVLLDIGGLNGLSQMPIYHEQNRSTGNLKVPVWEDMAETLGSYLLGHEYFLYRLQNSRVPITQEQAEELVNHVVTVVSEWFKRKGE